MKRILLATLAILCLLTSIGGRLVAQDNIAVWKFPSNNTAVTCVSDGISESDCSFSAVGNVNTSGTNSQNTLLCDDTDDTKSLQVLGQDGGSVIFKISTLPYRNIVVSYDLRCHPTLGGNPNYSWSYSFDGVSYTNAPASTSVTNFTATTFTTQIADFSSITAMNGRQAVWFKLTMSGATSNVTSNLDNVVFTGIPFTCMAPVDVVAVPNDAVDEAVVSWSPAGTNETSYTVVYYAGAVNQSALNSMASANYNTVTNATSPQTITGLDANTTYYIYVRANCGGNDESMWSQAAIVTTPARCTIADLSVSNIGGTTATLSWNTEAAGARVRVFLAPTETPWETSTGLVFEQSVADTFCNVTGMQYSTDYYAYVKSACTERNLSEPISTTFTTAFADNVIDATIGEAETSANTTPFNNYYKNSWDQSIYTVNEIGHAGTIGTVSWYSASTATVHFTDLRIYMGLTSMSEASSTSSWVPMDDLTLVYSSTDYTVGGNVGWETFYLDTPYEYDGSQNLVVVVAKKTANYNSSCTYRYTTTTNRVLYRQSDSDESYASHPGTATGTRSSYLPNIKFGLGNPYNVCLTVSAIVAINKTDAGFTVSWTRGGEESAWMVKYGEAGFDVETEGTLQNVTDTFCVIGGLEASTAYDVYVKSACDAQHTSGWTLATFTTECAAESVPYVETFEDVAGTYAIPECWERISSYSSGSTVYPYVGSSSSSAHTGSRYLYMYIPSATTANENIIALPPVNDINTLQVSLWAKYSSNVPQAFEIGYMRNGVFTAVFDTTLTTSYKQYTAYLNMAPADADNIAIRAYHASSYTYVYIDDIEVNTIPSCIAPSAITVYDVTTASASVSWTDVLPATAWQYQLNGGEIIDVDAKPISLTGLTENTAYTLNVRTVCENNDYSEWSSVGFRTECGEITIEEGNPYIEGFEEYTGSIYSDANGEIPGCWETSSTGTVSPHIIGSGSYYYVHSGTNALTFYGSGNCYAVLPAFTNDLNTLYLSFWSQMESTSYGTLTLGYITAADVNMNTFTEIETYESATMMTRHNTSLANLPASATRLVFRWYYSSQWSCCIDDLTVRVVSSAAEITAFSFAEDASVAVINNAAASVNSTVSYTTSSLNGLVPTIRVSDFATISPASGVGRDFSSPVTYTVTAEDGTTKEWTVIVTKETVASSAKDIISFSFANQVGESVIDNDNHTVSAQIVWDYDLADNITPTITVSPQARISPASGTAHNFTNPVTYTVTAEDASTQTWTVTIITDPSVCVNPLASTFTAPELTSTSATIAWVKRYQETSYNVKVSSTVMNDLTATADLFDCVVNDTLIALTGLAENTQYYMYVQSTCGAEAWTNYSFRTIVEPATIPYVCGFEDATENNQWILINGTQTNKWHIGTASNNGGENGLYISNDNGVTNAYTVSSAISFDYAYRTINFPANSDYIISFDWKAYGESNYDYIRAWLVPASIVLTAGQLPDGTTGASSYVSTTPEGWISLDGGSKLNLQNGWQTSELAAVSVPSGKYNMVFMWCNDNGGGTNPPASIDNISVTQVSCPTVANITATATQNTADIAWTERGSATEWAVVVSETELTEEQLETAEMHIVDAASYLATGLNSNTTYYIYVRANCSTEDVSDWRRKQIRTECGANVLPYSENFDDYTATAYDAEGIVPYCWSVVFSGSDEGFAPHVTNTSYYQPNSGSKYLVMSVAQNEAEGTNAYALMPELMNGYANTNVSFEYRAGATNRGTFSLGYMVGETYTNLTDITLGSTSKTTFSYSVPSTVPANAVLALKLSASGAANLSLGIDNVYVRETSSAAEITAFSFAQDAEAAEIISELATVNSSVSFSTESLEALVPTIAISEYATIAPASGVARDFSAPVTYTVTAEDGTIKEWTVNVTKQTVASSAKDILSFSFSGQRGESVIDTENHTVTAYTEWNYNFNTNITPTITVSPQATISPASGIAQNFATPFTYTVMAEDSTTQDWIVTLAHDPNQCVNPLATSMVVRDLTSSSATVAWVKRYDANETSFNVKVSTTAMTDMTATANTFDGVVNDTLIVLTGLSDATTYYVYVQIACGIEAWVNKSFTTPCVVVTSLPWSEDFNTLTTGIPMCWDNSEGTTTTASYRWNYYSTGHSGAGLRFNSYINSNGYTNMLKTPAFDLSSYVGASLTFWYKNSVGGDFSVYVSTDGGVTYTNNRIATGLTGTSTWTEMTYDITPYIGNNVMIVFKGTSNYGSGDAYIYLDDVSIDVVTCPVVSDLQVADQTSSSATISWTENGNADNWQIVISETSLNDPASGTINNVTATTYNATGLDVDTDYIAYIRAKCEEDDFSDWMSLNFYTVAVCPVPEELTAANVLPTAATINWTGYTASLWTLEYKEGNATNWTPIENIATASYALTTVPNTSYSVRVKAVCGVDGESEYSSTLTFHTPCNLLDLPMAEGFNGTTMPDCWNVTGSSQYVSVSATQHFEGSRSLAFNSSTSPSGTEAKVITPAIDFTDASGVVLTFKWYHSTGYSSYTDEGVQVQYSLDGNNWTNVGDFLMRYNATAGWEEVSYSIPALANVSIGYIGFNFTSRYGAYCYLDDVLIRASSQDNTILSYAATTPQGNAICEVDNEAHTISVELRSGYVVGTNVAQTIVPNNEYAIVKQQIGSNFVNVPANFVWHMTSADTTLTYKVIAENGIEQIYSATVTVEACGAPYNLIAEQTNPNTIDLSWSAVEGTSSWNVFCTTTQMSQSELNALSASEYTTVNSASATFDVAGETAYYWYVRTSCGGTYSAWMESSFVSWENCVAPANVTTELVDNDNVVISWDAMANLPIVHEEYLDSFERTGIDGGQLSYTNSTGSLAWTIANNVAHSGSNCIKSASGNNSATSEISLVVNYINESSFSFWYKVSSESGYDEFSFVIDENEVLSDISGEVPWTQYSTSLPAGNHTLRWRYYKDVSVASGSDCVWIDDIAIMSSHISNESQYVVYKNNAVLATLPASQTTYTDESLADGNYCYSIQTICREGNESALSEPVCQEINSCYAVTELSFTDVTYNSVALSWTRGSVENAWNVIVNGETPIAITETTDGVTVDGDEISYLLSNLEPNTDYIVTIQSNCDGTLGQGLPNVQFSTERVPAALPFTCDFENASENSEWVLENGTQPNKWYIGNAANYNSANGLYISNDNGISNNYDNENESYVYAYRLINVTEEGSYNFSFDWRCNGEEEFDFLRAFVVPTSMSSELFAGNYNGFYYYGSDYTPEGWIDIATGELSAEPEWQHSEKDVELTAGTYNVVFMWGNDDMDGDPTPAAIDNVSIERSVFTVTTSHIGLGSISPEGETQVVDGGQFQMAVTPMDGFMLESLMVDNVDYADSLVNNVLTLTVHEDLTIVANFDVPHTILASAGVGGTITPEGSVQVGNGESKTFAIASNVGYIISSVIADTLELISEGQELVNFSYTFNNVRDDHTIVATFEVAPSHTILATASEGGTISPSGTITVLYNDSQTFEFTPNEGYRLSRVMVDTTSNVTTFVENNTYTFNNVIANHSINAEFVANSYNLTVHYVYADNTTAAPNHTESVTFGTTYSVTSPVITGYTADQLVVEGTMPANNVELTVIYNVNSYNLTIHYVYAGNDAEAAPDHTEEVAFGTAYSVESPVIANYTADQLVVDGTMPAEDVVVTVTYNVNNYNLTIHYVYAENNAEAAPDHTEEVAYGAQYSVSSPVINGYTADQLTVAGTMPAEDVVVTVTYNVNSYNLTIHYVYAENDAEAAPDHTEEVAYGAQYSVESPVIDGYTADQLTVAGTMPANDVNVTVRYTENGTPPTTYTIVASTGNGGTITPNGTITVNEGADQSFTITPNAGYRIASVLVDNADATSQLVNGVYTFTNVRANHTIVSTFEPASSTTYTITASAGNGGTITPNNVVTVAEGANQTFRFTPDNGYRIATVVVDGNNVMDEVVDYSYTFYDVRANHTIYVTFTDGDAVDEYTTSSMSVYPNPNNGMFSIDFSRIEGDATYQLIDARGAVVETRDINVMDGDTMNFNHNLRPGSYFVRIITADKVYVEQIVVE